MNNYPLSSKRIYNIIHFFIPLLFTLRNNTIHGENDFIKTIKNIPTDCIKFVRYSERYPTLAILITTSASLSVFGFYKAKSCYDKRRGLEKSDAKLSKIVASVEQYAREEQKTWGANWQVTVNYDEIYKQTLNPKSELCKMLINLYYWQQRYFKLAVFSFLATGVFIRIAKDTIDKPK